MKNVLLIGDSMRGLYQPRVTELLGEDVRVYAPEENCRYTKYALWGMYTYMEAWGHPKFDAIHWNTGVWDLHRCTADGEIFTGANVENSSYGGTICAERVAMTYAVTHGYRKFEAIAIVGAPRGSAPTQTCLPCGLCRQVMSEFCGPDFKVVLADGDDVKIYTLDELLPHMFSSDMLN